MQQTKNYKLNKLEMGDVFSTQSLSENADKVEAALLAEAAAREALDGRVRVLELHRMAAGRFSGPEATMELDFEPKVVIAMNNSHAAIAIPGGYLTYNGRALVSFDGNVIRCGSDMNGAIYLALA